MSPIESFLNKMRIGLQVRGLRCDYRIEGHTLSFLLSIGRIFSGEVVVGTLYVPHVSEWTLIFDTSVVAAQRPTLKFEVFNITN